MKTLLNIFFVIISIFMVACGGDEDENKNPVAPETKSQIQMAPSQLSITDLDTATFYLSLQNSAAKTWRVKNYPKWILLSKTSGEINDDIVELKAVVDKSYSKKGQYSGLIEIATDDAGECHSQIEAFVGLYPDPYLPTSEIYFDSVKVYDKFITIINRGEAPLNAILIPSEDWIRSGGAFSIPPNSQKDYKIHIDQYIWLPYGIQKAEIKLYYNNYKDSLTIRVTANIEEIKKLRPNVDTLKFDFEDTEKKIEITNIGNTNYQWTFASDNPALSCFPNSGNIEIKEKVELTVSIDRNKCLSGYLDNFIYLIDPANDTISIPLSINHFKENKLLIEGEVVDATYNKATDRLLLVTEDPNKLLIVNINDYAIEEIPLKFVPNRLAVSKDGQSSVVSHDAYISYFDLSTKQETHFFSLPYDVGDIVLAQNAWTYFVATYNSNIMGYIDKNRDSIKLVLPNYTIYSNIILHPNDQFIYSDKGIKYDFHDDTLKYLYEYPHKNTHDMRGKIRLITEDKNIILTSSGELFKTSANKDEDMIYIAKLDLDNYSSVFEAYSSEINKFAVIEYDGSIPSEEYSGDKVTLFDANSYAREKSIQLPYFGYLDERQKYQLSRSEARYCFFNRDGSKIITLMHSNENYPGDRIWAVFKSDPK